MRMFLLVFTLLTSAIARAQQAIEPLTAESRAAALRAIEDAFEQRYVFPEMRPTILAKLEEARLAGRYEVDDAVLFAERITADLREVSHDAHVSLQVDPAGHAAALAPSDTDAGQEAWFRRLAIRDHHGLVETRVLPGNIRYLRVNAFHWVNDLTGAAYDDAARFLREGDAVIIDLRGNGGGSHAAVRYLVSHFLAPDRLEMTFLEGSNVEIQSRTLEHLPAGRMIGKPLYVLVDGGSASAAEAFAYDVQQFEIGEIVGTKTVGGANNNEFLPIAPVFVLSISFGRPVHPVSETNWEGTGVVPDVEVASSRALDTAHSLALERLLAGPDLPPEAAAEYRWARTGAEARLRPPTVSTSQYKALVGRYGSPDTASGVVEIHWREGAAWFSRPGRPGWPAPLRLIPLTADGLYGIEGIDFLRVRAVGRRLELSWPNQPPRLLDRSR